MRRGDWDRWLRWLGSHRRRGDQVANQSLVDCLRRESVWGFVAYIDIYEILWIVIQLAQVGDVQELSRLYIAYRVFYGEPPKQHEAEAFIRERVMQSSGRYFLARNEERIALGFMHLMPSTNTLAMRPIWFLEDLYVDETARGQGIASALLSHAEAFARTNGAERLTLATAHDNLTAQRLYQKHGYTREDHFFFFHRLLP